MGLTRTGYLCIFQNFFTEYISAIFLKQHSVIDIADSLENLDASFVPYEFC
jgi:hypothetical protein